MLLGRDEAAVDVGALAAGGASMEEAEAAPWST
jgi:hypothetical protein